MKMSNIANIELELFRDIELELFREILAMIENLRKQIALLQEHVKAIDDNLQKQINLLQTQLNYAVGMKITRAREGEGGNNDS